MLFTSFISGKLSGKANVLFSFLAPFSMMANSKRKGDPHSIELNYLRKIICLRKSEGSVEFQFVLSLKIWQSMAYTVCHAPIPMMS